MKTKADGTANGTRRVDVAVVGGGLGGLAAAALLARSGLEVVLLERATSLGGRASTENRSGFSFNQGAHAFYAGGEAARVLAEMGVRPKGNKPPASGVMVRDGHVYKMPSTLGALLTTGMLSAAAKLQGARLFAGLGGMDVKGLAGVAYAEWIASQIRDASLRDVLEAFVRVSTYANAPGLVSAGVTIEQLALAQGLGVRYLDGGWQPLVTEVATAARTAGAELRVDARVRCAVPSQGGFRVDLADAAAVDCRALVLATGPAAARTILSSDALASWVTQMVPARVACLDVGLSSLPDERLTFALGVDQPLYLSVHSRTAVVAPKGAAMVCTMKYLPAGAPSSPERDLVELEAWLDRLQPGWRDALLERRWLPSMVASHAVVTARSGGFAGRPGPAIPDTPGAFVVGDWVGDKGMLLDACLASASSAQRALGLSEANVKVVHHRARLAMRAYDRDRARTPPGPELAAKTRAALERFLTALLMQDAAAAEACLADGARLVSDGGGEFHAALRPVLGKNRIQRFFFGLQRKLGAKARYAMRTYNGLPAVVGEYDPPQEGWGERFLLRCDVASDETIASVHIVVASRKMTRVASL